LRFQKQEAFLQRIPVVENHRRGTRKLKHQQERQQQQGRNKERAPHSIPNAANTHLLSSLIHFLHHSLPLSTQERIEISSAKKKDSLCHPVSLRVPRIAPHCEQELQQERSSNEARLKRISEEEDGDHIKRNLPSFFLSHKGDNGNSKRIMVL
jgi:hypothetical protein